MKDPRAFAALKRLVGRQLWALQAMALKGEPGKKVLLEYLGTSPSPDLRPDALSSLCSFRDADVVATVRQSLADRNVQMRVAGIRCLARILDPTEAVAMLKPLLDDEALEAREAASAELGRLGDPSGSVPPS
jgi:HEAT repeat protein